MKLVGATDWFIRWPFVLEGVMVGVLGGTLAVLLLGVVKVAVVDPLAADFALIAAPETMNFPLLIALLLLRLDRRVGARLGHLAAPLPARLALGLGPRGTVSGRSMRRSVLVIAVLVPVLLVTGIWLGGHPSVLPGFLRDRLVDDGDAQVYEEAVDIIKRDYYREVDRDQLLDKSLGAAVKSLDDQFSNYFSPKDYADFQEVTQGQFSGVGMTVEETKKGLRVMTVYDGSPADKGGLKPGDVVTEVNGRSIAGASSEASTARIKGPAGTSVTLTVKCRQARARGPARARAGGHPGRGVLDGAPGLAQGRPRAPRRLHLRRARRGLPGRAQAAARGRRRDRARPARQRRRPAQRGGARLLDLHPRGPDRLDEGPRPPRARLRGHGRRDPDEGPGRRARQPPVGVRVGDRHGRAAGPQARRGRRHAHVRQGRLPGDRAALQRRRAGHHRRRVLPAQRPQHRRRGRRQGRRHRARRQGRRRPEDQAGRGARRRRSASSCATAREAPPRRGGPPDGPPAGRPRGRRARAARALPGRRAVLPSRAAHERRPPAAGLGGAARRPRARLAERAAVGPRARSCAGSGGRTWPAT